MNTFRLLAITAVLVTVVACDSKKDTAYEVRYLPYFDYCQSGFSRMIKLLNGADEITATGDIISPTDQLVRGSPFTKYVRLKISSARENISEPIINRYLFECGPNASIELSREIYDDGAVRAAIGSVVGNAGKYSGDYVVEISEGKATVYFNKRR